MRLAFAADFHGSQSHFSSFLDLVRQKKAAAAVVGGDLFPVTRPYEDMLRAQHQFVRTMLRQILEIHFGANGCPVYLQPGNNDWKVAFEELSRLRIEGLVAVTEAGICPLPGGCYIVSLPYIPPSPFRQKDFDRRDMMSDPAPDAPNPVYHSAESGVRQVNIHDWLSHRPSIEEELDNLGLETLQPAKTIYVMHSPPFRTGLDRTASGLDVGSKAIRSVIEARQPLLTLHGHIHEAPSIIGAYAVRIGQTISVNPGQTMERLHAVVVDANPDVTLWHTVFGGLTISHLQSSPIK